MQTTTEYITVKKGKLTFTLFVNGEYTIAEGNHTTKYDLFMFEGELKMFSFFPDKEAEFILMQMWNLVKVSWRNQVNSLGRFLEEIGGVL